MLNTPLIVTSRPVFNCFTCFSSRGLRSSLRPVSSAAFSMSSEQSTSAHAASVYKPRYIDIGINLADPIFRGQYHGKQRHPDDLSAVVSRAREVGCQKLIVTGSDMASSRHALEIAKDHPGTVYTTAGIHPCSSSIFGKTQPAPDHSSGHSTPCDPDPTQPTPEDDEPDDEKTKAIIAELRGLIEEARRSTRPSALVAVGEIGLDYDRLHYCSRRVQQHAFAAQLDLALSLDPPLPLFLHSRAAHGDFVSMLRSRFGPRLERLARGAVVHSFTGTAAELHELTVDLGLHVGANGCSFKTAENCDVVRAMPLDRLMIETDGPWCEIRPSHEGWKYLVAATKKDVSHGTGQDGLTAAPPTSGTSTPASSSAAATPSATGTSTPSSEQQQHQQQQQQPRKSKKQPQKKEPEVPERFPTVKKERWVEGAMVKGRNEPCAIEHVGAVVAAIKGVPLEEVCEAAWRNTTAVFDVEDSKSS
ncbi:hypothetical protein GGR56DRAFT_20526 [Xylariaceae sp. FL0804]|nr:hypothetical protein GGR56DRAFT_20526 [Xylariaceae sp. FL0804]